MLIVFVRIIDQRECRDNSDMKTFLFHLIMNVITSLPNFCTKSFNNNQM